MSGRILVSPYPRVSLKSKFAKSDLVRSSNPLKVPKQEIYQSFMPDCVLSIFNYNFHTNFILLLVNFTNLKFRLRKQFCDTLPLQKLCPIT